ncbi:MULTISPECIES: Na+/H+ antiporter subunit E [Sinobaca]|uniref:Multisubunit sodium/proton antiporter MrpE subunit n=1 Tax=Sinobaca qinghaiensis TaxID=342944 RepID=A0A419V4U4_9BACL|nr:MULTISPECIES: Na+/H+ antiporter subunit E [Sinobaca]RKD73452.1 multisubunit sodium/proton antiporter MrpE subunit [Sinobaca qinghaiensis]
MPAQILLNILIAVLWASFQDEEGIYVTTLMTGYVIGLVLIFSFRRFFPKEFYLWKLWSITKLLFIFIRELVSSSILVIRQILRPRLNITPGIFKLETELSTDWEITFLAMLLMLTPGSVVMEVSAEGNVLYIHAMDIPESQNKVIATKNSFEQAIMEVTR